ncbi:MAG: RIO1 family regulatory kinase/ATPase domain-containing protein [Candidatus Kariarchaeaceae archaeon]|jgi:serine/threonine-protein kinase RIO1
MNILGIDLHFGSQDAISYSFCLMSKDTVKVTQENVDVPTLIEFMSSSEVNVICVDNISEILKVEPLSEYLLQSDIEVRLLTGVHSNSQSVVDVARQNGISLRKKPDSLKTAIICAQLAAQGMAITLVRNNGKIGFEHQIQMRSTNQILTAEKLPGESTHREAHAQLDSSVYIKSIRQVVGYGKESIVYHAEGLQHPDLIVKIFRTYSSVARAQKSQIHQAKINHMPLFMAKNEIKYLRQLAQHHFPVPKPYFLDDNMVGMEVITLDGELAPTLAEFSRGNHQLDVVEDLVYTSLEMLQDMFSQPKLVHGDYSANNLLVGDSGLVIIDVAQTLQINTNTFTTTPDRIRMDDALDTLFRDLHGIITFFEKNFRIHLERDTIFEEFSSVVPRTFAGQVEFVLAGWSEKFRYS